MLKAPTLHEVRLPLAWQLIESVRQTVEKALAERPEALREAAVMVASELAENVVKYGLPLDGDDSGKISLELGEDHIALRSENGADDTQAERVHKLVDLLGSRTDLSLLYTERLSEMSRTPSDAPTELGLLRIAFEGGFAVRCSFAQGRLVIEARRSYA